jgi:hypothetical protein
VNTPTFTWAYTRTFKERGKKRSVTRSTWVVSQMQWDAVYLNLKKRKIGYEKYSQNNNNHNKSGKVRDTG